jgi:hypothetical protein
MIILETIQFKFKFIYFSNINDFKQLLGII